MFEQLGLIGCGLMGGSFALAARRAGVVKRVTGFSKSPESCERARQLGVIDVAASSAQEAAAGSDLVLLAIPVAASETTFAAIRAQVTPQTLVLGQFRAFAPDHGARGRRGRERRSRSLRRQAGDPHADQAHAAREGRAGQRALAGAGLPRHADDAAGARRGLCRRQPPMHQSHGKDYLGLAGPGFRDFSRIAAADPHMWRDVLIANREEIAEQSRRFKDALSRLEKAIAASDGDVLERLITQASHTRATLRLTSGAR